MISYALYKNIITNPEYQFMKRLCASSLAHMQEAHHPNIETWLIITAILSTRFLFLEAHHHNVCGPPSTSKRPSPIPPLLSLSTAISEVPDAKNLVKENTDDPCGKSDSRYQQNKFGL